MSERPHLPRSTDLNLRLMPASFLALIGVGTLVLALPFTHRPGVSVSFLDALFVATSASCVTGLSTISIADTFNLAGQIVLLLLIQLGGLGIMTAGTLIVLLIGSRLSLRHEVGIHGTFGRLKAAHAKDVLLYACIFVFILEFAGVVALFTLIASNWPEQEISDSLWQAAFHSVSAFCNAGLSIYPDGLARWRSAPLMLFIIDLLVIFGGLGLLSLVNLRFFYPWRKDRRKRGQLTLQTKISVSAAFLLLVVGTLLTLLFDCNRSLKPAGLVDKVSWAFFHSTMSRTAGFSVVNVGDMHPATLHLTMLLMFIGGAPGSMAGGIKTTTATLLLLNAWAEMRRSSDVNIFGRRVPRSQTRIAVLVFLFAATSLMIFLGLLMLAEDRRPAAMTPHYWHGLIFEAISAFGTVGLSTGVTPLLSPLGKLIIISLMFLGRVGPLLLALYLCKPVLPWHVRYPEESVSLG